MTNIQTDAMTNSSGERLQACFTPLLRRKLRIIGRYEGLCIVYRGKML